jgi:hypothetical protein
MRGKEKLTAVPKAEKAQKRLPVLAKSAPFGHKNQFVFQRICKSDPLLS